MPDGYEPRFDIDYERGLVGEKLVGTFLQALSGTKIEVKTDYQAWRTGNVYVETMQRTKTGIWIASGINISESEWYCIAGPTGVGFIAIRKDALYELARLSPKTSCNTASKHTNASIGRLVRISDIIATLMKQETK
jgi:hypothetical protein